MLIDKFKELYVNGYSVYESMNGLEISEEEICKCIETLSDEEVSSHKEKIKLHVIDLFEKGYTISQIVRKTSISRPKINSIIQNI